MDILVTLYVYMYIYCIIYIYIYITVYTCYLPNWKCITTLSSKFRLEILTVNNGTLVTRTFIEGHTVMIFGENIFPLYRFWPLYKCSNLCSLYCYAIWTAHYKITKHDLVGLQTIIGK